MRCVYAAIYTPPPASQYTGGSPSPPPQGAEERIGRLRQLPGQYCVPCFLDLPNRLKFGSSLLSDLKTLLFVQIIMFSFSDFCVLQNDGDCGEQCLGPDLDPLNLDLL